jgi:phosphopantothenoylcysteine decarboxylase/phosphopantothenate--cysteine ligase
LYVIAPATANLIAKFAHGLADDMVTTTALAATCRTVIAPAMNVHMYDHPAVQANLQILRERGVIVLDPGEGPLACGYTGKGRMPEPEDIAQVVEAMLAEHQDLAGLHFVITAGPTVEDIDPVRYLSNRSSGKMGYALAQQAVQRGAEVTLVSGPTHLHPVPGAKMMYVRSTTEMLSGVQQAMKDADVLIAAAAPADYRPVQVYRQKWKKADGLPQLELEQTPDILANVSLARKAGQTIVGFAAETRDAIAFGRRKLTEKGLDLIVVNDVSQPGAGFDVDTNQVILLTQSGEVDELPLMAKSNVADRILTRVKLMRSQKNGEPQG